MSASDTLELPETIPQTSPCYRCIPYKQAFYYGQQTYRKYQAQQDHANYWKKKAQELLAENTYLKKLLFGRKSEKDAASKTESQDSTTEDSTPRTHGAQKGHPGSGRNIPRTCRPRSVIIPFLLKRLFVIPAACLWRR